MNQKQTQIEFEAQCFMHEQQYEDYIDMYASEPKKGFKWNY